MYAIIRMDVEMTPGKAAAQAGHAFLEAFLAAQRNSNTSKYAELYRADDTTGTKICLAATEQQMTQIMERLKGHTTIPWVKIVDSGHVHPPHFDGTPILTAIGIGPVLCDHWLVRPLLEKLPLYVGPLSSGKYTSKLLEQYREIRADIKDMAVKQKQLKMERSLLSFHESQLDMVYRHGKLQAEIICNRDSIAHKHKRCDELKQILRILRPPRLA